MIKLEDIKYWPKEFDGAFHTYKLNKTGEYQTYYKVTGIVTNTTFSKEQAFATYKTYVNAPYGINFEKAVKKEQFEQEMKEIINS